MKRNNYLEYAAIVHRAKLSTSCKALLWHYAWAFNWTHRRPSFYTQQQICALISMSPSSYQKARKRLVELGWIIEERKSRVLPVFVTPKIGTDDPNYDSWSWSRWHPSNEQSIEEFIADLPEDFRNPFENYEAI